MEATKSWLFLAALLTAPGLAGCGGSSSSSTAASPPTLTPRSVSAVLPDGLTGTLTEDRTSLAVGGMVNYTLILTNSTASPITYQPIFGAGNSLTAAADVPGNLEILDSSGRVAYPTELNSQVVTVGANVTLAPGQSVSAMEAIGSGTYSHAGQYTAQATFSIAPGTPQENNRPPVVVGPLTASAQ